MIIASVQFTFAPEDADRVEAIFRELRDASVKEPGIIEFQSTATKRLVEAHRASEHFQRLVVNGVRPLATARIAETVIPI